MKTAISFLLIVVFAQQTIAQRKHWINVNGGAVKKELATSYYTLTKTASKSYIYKEYNKQTDSLFEEVNYPTKECLSREGRYKRYFENGKLAVVGEYLNNKKTGIWNYYARNGEKSKSISYQKGLKKGDWIAFKNGKKNSIFRYQADSLHSLVLLLDETGDVIFKEDTSDRAVYHFVDEEAIFSERDKELKEIQSTIKGMTKKIYISFNVDKNGVITEIGINNLTQSTKLEEECKEALKIIARLPQWKEPAVHRGRIVKSKHEIVIR